MPAESTWMIIVAGYTVMSAITFIAFWRDKRAASRHDWRTPEATLHLLEVLGGWPGALLAQRMLRHKSSKRSYRIVLWLIIALHSSAWLAGWWILSHRA